MKKLVILFMCLTYSLFGVGQTYKIVKRIIKSIQYKTVMADFIQLSNNEYIGYSNDTIKSGITQLAIFDSCGQVLHTVTYPESYAYIGYRYPNAPFYENDFHYYFVGPYEGKTVYEIKEGQLVPYLRSTTRQKEF